MKNTARRLAVLFFVVGISAAQAQDGQFLARLSTVPINPGNRAEITGEGGVSAALSARRLSVEGRFQGLQSPAIAANLHWGSRRGVRGPAIAPLEVTGGQSGSVSGTVVLSRAQLAALHEGRIYIQLHSEGAPDGNLWGWLLR